HVPAENPAVLARYTAATEHVPTTGIVKDMSDDIVRGQKSDIDKARAIYEWIVDNTYRDGKVRGCGTGDINFMLENKAWGGKCADLNALFVAFARAQGIPARDVYGVRVAGSKLGYKSLGKTGGYITGNDVTLPGATRGTVAFLMYPQCETGSARVDSLDADNFKYTITSKEL